MLPVTTQKFYARKWPILIIFSIIALPFIILKLQGDQNKVLDIFLWLTIIFSLLLFLWAKYMSITIDNDGIEYQAILIKRFIAWKDVKETSLTFEFHGKSGDFVWNFTSIKNKSINFSAGYFSKNSIQLIAETVIQKCPECTIKGTIKKASEGKFPWYFF